MRATRAHYEKIICGCCLLLMFTNVGLASTSFNVYQPYIVAAVGDENGSNVLLLRTLVSLICMMLVGKWYKLLDCRLGAFVAGCFTTAGFLTFSFAGDFAGYCCGAVLAGAGYGLGGMVACTMLINRWYKVKVGTALGIVAAGSSIAGITMPLAASLLIGSFGLGWSFRAEAILAFALAALCFILLRNNPSDIGLAPLGAASASEEKAATEQRAKAVEKFRGAREPLPLASRCILWVAMLFMGCVAVDGWNYLSVLMTHAHFDATFVAPLLSVGSIAMLLGKLATGALFDKVGTLRASIVFFSILLAGLVLCTFADFGNASVMVVAVILLGFGVSLGTVGISVWSIDLSTPLERGKLIKDLQVAYATGGFLFNLIPGRIVEAGGSYTTSFVILTILCLVEALVVISTYCRRGSHAAGKGNLPSSGGAPAVDTSRQG